MAQADLLFSVLSFLVYILNDICERKYNTYSSERCMHMCHLQGIILFFPLFYLSGLYYHAIFYIEMLTFVANVLSIFVLGSKLCCQFVLMWENIFGYIYGIVKFNISFKCKTKCSNMILLRF